MKTFLKKNLVQIVFAILAIILFLYLLFASTNPNSWLIGWDNFSVSLNLRINTFRTLFSTWRDYRGLGVPGDSESVDIFRIILQTGLSIFVPSNLIDQIYYLLLYLTGIIGMYFLANQIFSNLKHQVKNPSNLKFASVLTSILYGFNYHVVETFLLPVAMYPTRYAFFPLIILYFIKLVTSKSIYRKDAILFIIFNLLGSTAYLTATVFITLGIFISLLLPSLLQNWKKFFIYGLSILLLNSFWVFPFANYTVQKANILPKASSFVSVNESLLNKPTNLFDWSRLLTYDPLTLSKQALPFTKIDSEQEVPIHPLFEADTNQINSQLLFFPSLVALFGFIGVIWFSCKNRTLKYTWPLVISFFIFFLLRKSLSPLGFIYQILSNNIPLFNVVFRFSGAKFYSLLLIAMSVLGGWGFLFISNLFPQKFRINKSVSVVLLILGCSLVISPFRSMLQQGLFDSLVKVEIPEGYSQLTADLNSQEKEGRVLHLPVDQYSYWKSYRWGYFGSSFLNFMLEEPLLDRTFEPASQENDFYFQQLHQEILATSLVTNQELEQRAKRLNQLFVKTGTRYIIFDSSVNTEILEEGLNAWGEFHPEEFQLVLQKMEDLGYLSIDKKYPINNGDSLTLYLVENYQPQTKFISHATNIDPNLENGFTQPLLEVDSNFIQFEDAPFRTYPLWQPKNQIRTNDKLNISFEVPHSNEVDFVITDQTDQVYQDLYASREENNLVLFFQPQWLPINYEFNPNLASKVVFEDQTTLDTKLALLIGEKIIEVPQNLETSPIYIGTFLLNDQEEFQLLSLEEENKVSNEQISLTQNPNCYQDQSEDYSYDFQNQPNSSIKLSTKNGSTCLSLPLLVTNKAESDNSEYFFKADFNYQQTSQTDNQQIASTLINPTQNEQQIKSFIDQQANYQASSICLFDIETGECLNKLNKIPTSTKPFTQEIWTQQSTNLPQVQVLLGIKAIENQQTEFELDSINYQVYSAVQSGQVTTPNNFTTRTAITYDSYNNNQLTLSFPINKQTKSNNDLTTIPCERENNSGYRSVTIDESQRVLLYTENCSAGSFIRVEPQPNINYLWYNSAKLFYGRYPQLIVSQNNQTFYFQYLSRFNLYPSVPNFKNLEMADKFWWSNDQYQQLIENEINQDNYHQEVILIRTPELKNEDSLLFNLNSFGEGLNLVGVEKQEVIPIPSYWSNLAIETGNPNLEFSPAQVVNLEKILPSLWKIKINTSGSENSNLDNYLLEFDQAYDKQWQIYKINSVLSALLGFGKIESNQVKVNGWANGWIIHNSQISGKETTLIVLYWPERLAILGWVITILTATTLVLLTGNKRVVTKSRQPFSKVRKKFTGK